MATHRTIAQRGLVVFGLLALFVLPGCGGGGSTPTPGASEPELSALVPANGPVGGGTTLTVTGEHFDLDAGDTAVTIGGAQALQVVVASPQELTCVTPAGAEGTADVVVTTPGGTATLADGFSYNPLPTVERVTPASGWAGDPVAIVVEGSGFQDYEPGANALTLGSAAAAGVVVVDDGHLEATCPAAGAGSVDVRVENANGTGLLVDGFSHFDYPLEFLSEEVRLDGEATVPLTAPGLAGSAGTMAADGRSDNAAVAASGSKVYVAWREMRNGIADIHFNRSLDGGATWLASDLRINHGGVGTDSAGEVALVCDGVRVAAVWSDWREGGSQIYFNASTDGGLTWSATDTRVSTSGGASKPCLVEESGTLHVVWRQGNSDVMYRRSADGGASWDDAVRVDAFLGGSDRPRLCVHGNYVYAAWSDGTGIYFNHSADGGSNWGTEERVDLGTVYNRGYVEMCCDASFAYLVWQDFRNDEVVDVYFRRWDALTSDWGDETLLDTDGAGASDAGTPKIGCGGNYVYVTWMDWRFGPYADVLFLRSVIGSSWETVEKRLNTNAAGSSAKLDHQLAYDGYNLYVVWTDTRNSPTSYEDIYFTSSQDGGTTWLASDVWLNDGSTGATAQRAQIACDGAHVYVAWQDSRPGLSSDLDIYATSSQP